MKAIRKRHKKLVMAVLFIMISLIAGLFVGQNYQNSQVMADDINSSGSIADRYDVQGINTDISKYNKPSVKIGFVTGTACSVQIQKALPNATFVSYLQEQDGYIALRMHKLDAFAVDRDMGIAAVRSDNSGLTYIDQEIGDTTEVAIGISKETDIEDLDEQLNLFIEQIIEDGTRDDMYNRWIKEGDKEMPDIPVPENPKGTLRVATTGICEPFTFYKDGQLIGFDMELIKRFAYYSNMELNIKTYSWTSIITALGSGKADCALSNLNVTDERSQVIDFSEPYYNTTAILMVPETAENIGFWPSVRSGFERTFINEDRWKMILSGLGVTILITALAALAGTFLGFLLCLLRRKEIAFFTHLLDIIVSIFQGVPILVILMVLYYIVFADINISAIVVAIIGFTLYFGIDVSEMMRVGIDAVGKGQTEAALSLGYSNNKAFMKIVMPQAAGHFLPIYKGEIIAMMKSTSIVGYLAIQDITKATDIIRSRTYEAFFPLMTSAILYFLISYLIILCMTRVEKNLNIRKTGKYDKRADGKA